MYRFVDAAYDIQVTSKEQCHTTKYKNKPNESFNLLFLNQTPPNGPAPNIGMRR
jgi:hypothetical protein